MFLKQKLQRLLLGTVHILGSQYSLNGFKWFSSATESDVAVALARTGKPEDGSRGLSLFLVPCVYRCSAILQVIVLTQPVIRYTCIA